MSKLISPYIEEKEVILCRSGYQLYTREQLEAAGMDLSELPVKDVYTEYRPPAAVVKAKSLFRRLPLTKEHPDDWVTPDNWNKLAGGTTGEEVEVVAIDDTDIGLRSSIVFNSKSLYNYYKAGNKEVSVGYLEKREIVKDNPNYDIIMLSIEEVNHCAVTAKGRGGQSVAILDSIIGGMKSMRTGLFHFLKRKGKTEDSAAPFSPRVFAALDEAKGKEGEDFEAVVTSVFDSVGGLKDGEQKEQLANMVRDAFENPDEALANKEELSKVLDSVYINISGSAISEIKEAMTSTVAVKDSEEAIPAKDSDGKGDNTNNVADSKKEDKKDEKEEKKEEKKESSSKDSDTQPSASKDSVVLTKEDIACIVRTEVQSLLGVTGTKDSAEGLELTKTLDSVPANLADAAGAIFG